MRVTPPSPWIAVVDVGTSTVRAHVLDADGGLHGSAERPQRVRLEDGRAEVDTDEVWTAVCACLREALGPTGAGRVEAVGVASALGYVLLDRQGAPLGPALLWMDRRAVEEATCLSASLGAEALYRTTGRRPDPEVWLPKLLWLRTREPDRFARVATFIGLKDDVVRRLTGTVGSDVTHAAYSMLYDVRARRWAPDLVERSGLAPAALPALRRADEIAGGITATASAATGLRRGVPVVVGTTDGTAAGLLAGAETGLAVNVTGTSDVVMTRASSPLYDAERRTVVNPCPLGEGWMLGAVLGTTGGSLKWLVDRLCPDLTGPERYRRLDDEAARVPPGARGVVCLAALGGERAPRWNASARGAFVGLGLTHGRAELARALLEAVALSVARVVGALRALGADVRRLRVVGGGAQSDLWNQLRADIAGVPVERPRSVQGTATAIALLAGLGLGWHADLRAAARRVAPAQTVFAPRPAITEAYRPLAELAERVYEGLEPVWPDLARWREPAS